MSDYDIFKLFENFINEENKTSDEENHQKVVSKELDGENLRAKKSSGKTKKKKSINQNEEDEDKDLDKEEKEEDTDDEDDSGSPATIHLKDALDYKKLKNVLNKFRAAHSLKKPDITEELQDYFQRLSVDEKKALFVFIKGLVQITGDLEADGDAANIPSDFGLKITKPGSSTEEKKKSKKRKIKSKDSDNMSPIKIESIQDKREIYKVLLENK